MRQQILRCTAIGFFGNDHLAASNDDRLTEVHFKSCFKGVESLDFVRPQAHKLAAPGTGFSAGSKAWFRRLKTDRVPALRLHLPVSIFEPLPAAYGLVLDGAYGSEVYVPAGSPNAKHTELVAAKIASWSIPPLIPVSEAFQAHLKALEALSHVMPAEGSPFGQIIAGLLKSAQTGANLTMGFDDLIPESFPQARKAAAAAAIRTVVSFTVPNLNVNAYVFAHRQIDAVWNTAMRLLEAVTAEIALGVAAAA